jgi:glycosyltransferase involved in cell wall biosynthesis
MKAAVIYAKFSPFHTARLTTTQARGRALGHELYPIEVAGLQDAYKWPVLSAGSMDLGVNTLFGDSDIKSIAYRTLKTRLRIALNEIRPDVAVLPGWGTLPGLAGLGWCIRARVPRVLISDSQAIRKPYGEIKSYVKRQLVRRFQSGFAAGTPHRRYLSDLGLPIKQCFLGCDVIDNSVFGVCASPNRIERSEAKTRRLPTILSCLRFIPEKNIFNVLTVLNRLRSWHWKIAGHGELFSEVREKISQLRLENYVTLLGHVAYADLPGIYANADVYLQPSLSDTWALAVNEAMASGLPVIVSKRCGCAEDLVSEGLNGFVFDPGEETGLDHVFLKMYAQRDRWPEMGQASKRIIATWNLELFARSFWQACDAAVATRPASSAAGDLLLARLL